MKARFKFYFASNNIVLKLFSAEALASYAMHSFKRYPLRGQHSLLAIKLHFLLDSAESIFTLCCLKLVSIFPFLKKQYSFWLFRTKYFEKKFNLQLYLSIVSHFFSHELPRAACLYTASCFEKITVCVIKTMLVTLPLVQRHKARREVNQQIKRKSR